VLGASGAENDATQFSIPVQEFPVGNLLRIVVSERYESEFGGESRKKRRAIFQTRQMAKGNAFKW
jgi:hypothetical protein